MGNLTFNGITILDTDPNPDDSMIVGVVIQTPPVYEFPSKRVDVIQIQGKNGDIIIDKNSYNNVVREYNIASVFGSAANFIPKVRKLVDWLTSANGYARLEDSYEPDYFRLAMFRSGGQLPNFYDQATAFALKFECKPQRFLKSGENSINISSNAINQIITNDNKQIALPKITIPQAAAIITISVINDDYPEAATTITLAADIGEDTILDSELQDAYTATRYVNNKVMTTNGFIKLYPGDNKITVTGATSNLTLIPNWWVL